VRSVNIWKHKKYIVIFKAKHSKKNLVSDGRILLNWISRILIITVWVMLKWESDSKDISIKVINL
jgi:hypothetical protein